MVYEATSRDYRFDAFSDIYLIILKIIVPKIKNYIANEKERNS